MIRLALLASVAAGCSAPPLPADLARAERHTHAGQLELALAAYDDAVASCRRGPDPRRHARDCVEAHQGRAELFERMNRLADAAATYEAIPAAVPDAAPHDLARATYRAGRLLLDLGDERRGYELLWHTITAYPNASETDHAAQLVFVDGRLRAPRHLFEQLGRLANRIPDTAIADNLWYDMALLAAEDLHEPRTAIDLYDQVVERYPDGPLLDDSLWRAAGLAHAVGDPDGAARRYRALLARREVAWINGSYLSEWMDDAQLALGVLLRDDLGDLAAALAAFDELPALYPDSLLHDDAQFERAVTLARLGRGDDACAALAGLAARWPDSRYGLERAPALAEQLACARQGQTGTSDL